MFQNAATGDAYEPDLDDVGLFGGLSHLVGIGWDGASTKG
jgi:hypothetical protein